LDVLGFTIPSLDAESNRTNHVNIKIVAGSHADGLRVWMSTKGKHSIENEIELGKYKQGLTWTIDEQGNTATLKYNTFGQVHIKTNMFDIKIVNSDMFFNLQVSLLDASMLRVGRTPHTITDHEICSHDKHGHAQVSDMDSDAHASHDHGLVESIMMKKYHANFPVHGLIGQTWRNVVVCGKHWVGTVQDYVVSSSLFGGDYYYNFYSSQ